MSYFYVYKAIIIRLVQILCMYGGIVNWLGWGKYFGFDQRKIAVSFQTIFIIGFWLFSNSQKSPYGNCCDCIDHQEMED